MKKILFALAALLMAPGAFAQQKIHSRNVDPFSKIELTGDMTVELIRADTAGVDVLLNGSSIDKLQWGVKDGTLSIRLKPGAANNGSAEVKLYYNDFRELKISQARVSAQDTITGLMVDIQLQAGGLLSGVVGATDLALKVSGNSAANLTGAVKYFDLIASGRSKINTREMECLDASLHAASSSEVYVWSIERLRITAESGAAVYYKGTPEIFRTHTSMMGNINNIGK